MGMIDAFRELGKTKAIELKAKVGEMDGTELIANEYGIAPFNPEKDYSGTAAGTPVTDEGQVWTLIQPYNAAHYEGRPSTLRALWGLAHTKDPKKAKLWVDAYGTSGMYMKDECYKDADGLVHRAKQDNLVYDAVALPSAWEDVQT